MSSSKLAISSAALAAVTGSALVIQGSDNESDLIASLRNIQDYDQGGSKANKFGGKYASYFMDPNHNISEWRKKFEELEEGNESSDNYFNEINDVNILKKKCMDKYDSEDYESNSTLANKIWKYCSFGDEEPSTIKDSSTAINSISNSSQEKEYTSSTSASSENKFGKSLKEEALSTYNPKNDWFWKIREEDFKQGRLDVGASSTSNYFDKTSSSDIKTLCRNAYEQTSNGNGTKPTADEIKKYCSLSKTIRT